MQLFYVGYGSWVGVMKEEKWQLSKEIKALYRCKYNHLGCEDTLIREKNGALRFCKKIIRVP